MYQRVGNVVTVWGETRPNASGAGDCQFTATLPIARTAGNWQVAGSSEVAGSCAPVCNDTGDGAGAVRASASGQLLDCSFTRHAAGADGVTVHFTYSLVNTTI